jgi:hypothetical protein
VLDQFVPGDIGNLASSNSSDLFAPARPHLTR